jgi:tyrosine-protein phosphatase YwqE
MMERELTGEEKLEHAKALGLAAAEAMITRFITHSDKYHGFSQDEFIEAAVNKGLDEMKRIYLPDELSLEVLTSTAVSYQETLLKHWHSLGLKSEVHPPNI